MYVGETTVSGKLWLRGFDGISAAVFVARARQSATQDMTPVMDVFGNELTLHTLELTRICKHSSRIAGVGYLRLCGRRAHVSKDPDTFHDSANGDKQAGLSKVRKCLGACTARQRGNYGA